LNVWQGNNPPSVFTVDTVYTVYTVYFTQFQVLLRGLVGDGAGKWPSLLLTV